MLRFSANLGFLWKELPLVEAVKRAKAAGFDAVEFHRPYDVPTESMCAVLAATGLPVVGLNTRSGNIEAGDFGLAAMPEREEEARAIIDEACAYASAIGAGCVHVLAGKPKPSHWKAARDTYLKALDHAASRAKESGLTILIEPLNRYDVPGYFLTDTSMAAEIIRELGRDNIQIMFDYYHVQISEGDLTRRIETLLPLIGHIQIAAVPSRREPDEGEVAYDRLLRAIEAMGYDGLIGAEYTPRGSVEEGLRWLSAARER